MPASTENSPTRDSASLIDWRAVTKRTRLAVATAAALLPKPLPLRLDEWLDENFYLSPESSGTEGAWLTLPYQRAPAAVIGGDEVRTVTWWKSKRVGYTKILVGAIAYWTAYKRRTVGLWEPTESDAQELKKDEINTAMRDVPAFREAMLADPETKSKHNTEDRVAFRGALLYVRGGKAARNYARLSLDCALYDELDRFDQSIEGAGSAVYLGDGRLTQSPFPKSVRGSTSRVKNESQIEASFDEADLQLYRLLPCPECGHQHRLEFKNLHYDKAALKGGDDTSALFACPECSAMFGYNRLSEMDAAGRWASEDGLWIDESVPRGAPMVLRDAEGAEVPWPRHVAFFIWSAYSYMQGWADLARLWVNANELYQRTGSREALKTVVNEELAETWTEIHDNINPEAFLARREEYAAPVPMSALVLVMGVDTQDDRLEFEVVGFGPEGESWGVHRGVLHGDPAAPEVWEQLDRERARTYKHESGADMRIMAVGIDTGGHKTQEVYAYCRTRHASKVYAIKGQGGADIASTRAATNVRMRNRRIVKLYNVGVDAIKARLREFLQRTPGQRGYCHFPMDYPLEYFEQLCGEAPVPKRIRGRERDVWTQLRARVEALDCRVYAMAALEILNPRFELMRPEPDTSAPSDDDDPPTKRRRRGGKRWSTTWR